MIIAMKVKSASDVVGSKQLRHYIFEYPKISAKIYLDKQNSSDIEWSYYVTRFDDHQESGACDNPEDGIRLISQYSWANVSKDLKDWEYHDHGGQESFRFNRPTEEISVVANLTNVYQINDIVAVAEVGTVLPNLIIEKRKIFGIESLGMALGCVNLIPGSVIKNIVL